MNEDPLRMMTLKTQGFYCSQILLQLGLEAQGKENPDLIRAVAGLAGGLGFVGDVCGTLTGGACLLGLYAGKGIAAEEEDDRLNLMIRELVDWFKEEFEGLYGGITCAVILGDDLGHAFGQLTVTISGAVQQQALRFADALQHSSRQL